MLSKKALTTIFSVSRASVAQDFDATGTLAQTGINLPRFPFDPVTRVAQGLIIEPARTNYTTNNSMAGAAAGTPGTDPSGWDLSNALLPGLTKQIVGPVTVAGVPCIDVRYFGTTAGGNIFPGTGGAGGTTSAGVYWTINMYLALVAGSLSNVTALFGVTNFNSGNVAFNALTTLNSTLKKYSATAITGAGVTSAGALFFNIAVAAGSVDFTLRIGVPQLEQGAGATSPILTSGTAVTRAADRLLATGVGSWMRGTAGTIIFDATSDGDTSTYLGGASDGTSSNAVWLTPNSANITVGGSNTTRAISPATGAVKVGLSWLGTSAKLCVGGGAVTSFTTSGTLPPLSQFALGISPWAASGFMNGLIRNATVRPFQLSDAALQGATT